MRKRRTRRQRLASPDVGRNLAVRPGAGPHKTAAEKRAADKLRRELDERRDDADEASEI